MNNDLLYFYGFMHCQGKNTINHSRSEPNKNKKKQKASKQARKQNRRNK